MRPAQLALPCAIALSFALAAAPACRKDDGTTPSPNTPVQPTAEGPAEKAGASADHAADKAEEGAKGAATSAGSAVEKAGDKTKKAGEDLKD